MHRMLFRVKELEIDGVPARYHMSLSCIIPV